MTDLPSRPRLLLRQLHQVMAGQGSAQERLDKLVGVIARNMVAEVCSVYLTRAGNILELFATEGLKAEAVHNTRLRVGEGLVGLIAQQAAPLKLSEASEHPRFAYRPETGEELYHSLLGVPIIRSGRVHGVLVVQNIARRRYADEEVEALQTVSMVLAELLGSGDLVEPSELQDDAAAALGAPVTLDGRVLSAGIAIGTAVLHEPRVQITRLLADDVEAERDRLSAGLDQLKQDFDAMIRAMDPGGGAHREILETYRMFAHDKGWQRRIEDAILSGLSAEAAVERVQQQNRSRLSQSEDPYLRQRIQDLDDISHRLIRILTGRQRTAAYDLLPEAAVLVARTLGPAELMDYDRDRLAGVILEDGAPTAHMSIVARAMGLPVLGNVEGALGHVEAGERVILDAGEGHAYLRPSDEVRETFQQALDTRRRRLAEYTAERDLPAVTRDGVPIDLLMNAGLLIDLPHLEETNAAGIGLFRTEFQFMVGSTLPRHTAQRDLYAKVLDTAGDRPVVFRTLDIGGDKPVPFLPRFEEENPVMGWRAIRIALDRPALLRHQVRALLAAGEGRVVRLMFPMVSDVAEFRAARAIVDKEVRRLEARGRPQPVRVEVGSMLEVPALAWQLPALLRETDFISIGTNDLLQFFYACDRSNGRLADRYDLLCPAVLNFLREIVHACDAVGVPVTVCGEMGGRPLEALALLGVGVRRLSVSAAAIGPIKRMIRSVDLGQVSTFLASLGDTSDHSLRPVLRAYAHDHDVALPTL
ncbi:phosphoenolpyruvate--protein phosphotransferase [Rhodothalassium salexigens]|uniref:phosphoenolpyruvate--protein phosphotransferase n=1 Tax=Rhodothalassium salexigens TaxID=1086 RepID=UPI001911E065|nr:phosphoenolpyruvate--protein phosphotransferase [Rhodothalassium salexigens]